MCVVGTTNILSLEVCHSLEKQSGPDKIKTMNLTVRFIKKLNLKVKCLRIFTYCSFEKG